MTSSDSSEQADLILPPSPSLRRKECSAQTAKRKFKLMAGKDMEMVRKLQGPSKDDPVRVL